VSLRDRGDIARLGLYITLNNLHSIVIWLNSGAAVSRIDLREFTAEKENLRGVIDP
jgi:hypothetical protein